MICEIWSRPVFEILSILDIDPEFLILEPASFREPQDIQKYQCTVAQKCLDHLYFQ